MNNQQNKGITLIALIITIIVMLILVGVTINISLNGGLFKNASEAALKTKAMEYKEQLDLIVLDIKIDRQLGDDRELKVILEEKIEESPLKDKVESISDMNDERRNRSNNRRTDSNT